MDGLLKAGKVLGLLIVIFAIGFYIGVGVFASGPGSGGLSREVLRTGSGETKVVVLAVNGFIDDGQATFARKAVDRILKDDQVKAVVLHINSPGGMVTSSDDILYQFKRLKAKNLPVIASYSGYAASGGYYISAFADKIYAQPMTITGSVGVIMQAMTVAELLNKVGVKPEILHSTAAVDKDTGSIFRDWTDKDRAYWKESLDFVQERFVDVVHEGRKKVMPDRAEVVKIATGRAFTSLKAKDLKLVDEIGYLDDAVKYAEKQAGLVEGAATIISLKPGGSLINELIGMKAASDGQNITEWLKDGQAMRNWLSTMSVPRMLYLAGP